MFIVAKLQKGKTDVRICGNQIGEGIKVEHRIYQGKSALKYFAPDDDNIDDDTKSDTDNGVYKRQGSRAGGVLQTVTDSC
ncbi:Uncharacterized protein BM_BM10975 [Brugia malayi]|uniref:Bm10975 n=1 Tax=Brugia malayi TaxID=6279 RepID=A0A0K0IQ66_BRUMA|nr:Uncharacterized protein BM_BM10975 [Brugia malayi]CRZ25995.1 Bm10975 [Brugia malayi]VIO86486.1 Uncharacterized protein BM_BM10975 [Brugia malayi]